MRRKYRFWKSRDIDGDIRAGCFVQDARGRWYVVFQCKVNCDKPTGVGNVGVDLGLKALATFSDGNMVPMVRHFSKCEIALGVAQRAKNKRRASAIHAKIANSRRHHLHGWSSLVAVKYALIAVGDVSASQMKKKHNMGKSVSDAAWAMFKHMLRYKASRHGAVFIEVDERWTSQTCSDCGVVSGPKGIAGLGIRHWVCEACGGEHDRDVNAARNILRVGLERQAPVEEIPASTKGRR
jgi:IS605 OrfB family transposase